MLEIKNLTKIYKGGKEAVSDLSLTVEAGDIYAFIGHNGAGKTSTIKCVVGIHDFDKGEIFVDGISVKENPLACKQIMAYIPDNPDLYEYLTGIQSLRASLPAAAAVTLVIISMLLTVIAGLFPSRVAAKKDPVVALRSE